MVSFVIFVDGDDVDDDNLVVEDDILEEGKGIAKAWTTDWKKQGYPRYEQRLSDESNWNKDERRIISDPVTKWISVSTSVIVKEVTVILDTKHHGRSETSRSSQSL